MTRAQTEEAAGAVVEPVIVRDARIDQLGFVAELQKQHADGLKTTIKSALLLRSAERCQGDFFEGLLTSSTPATIDPGKFLRLYEKGSLTRAELVACLTIKRDAALEYVSRSDLEAISSRPAEPTLSLRVSRIKGVEVRLVDALRGLANQIKAES